MSTRLCDIREACRLPPESRSPKHVDDILDYVKDCVKFFSQLSMLQQRKLCTTITLETFAPNEYIFLKDDLGDKFYIVLTGWVSVLTPAEDGGEELEKGIFLGKGASFGELALHSESARRSASIQCTEKTETLVMTRGDYKKFAEHEHRLFIEQRVTYLSQCPKIDSALRDGSVELHAIKAMANCISEVMYSGADIAIRQGDPVENMIFVRSGQLAMLRLVDFDAVRKEASRRATLIHAKNISIVAAAPAKKHPRFAVADEDDSDTEPSYDPTASHNPDLSMNLAKAIMDMRKQERKAQLQTLESETSDNPAAFRLRAMVDSHGHGAGPRSSLLPGIAPHSARFSSFSSHSMASARGSSWGIHSGDESESPSSAGKGFWNIVSASMKRGKDVERGAEAFVDELDKSARRKTQLEERKQDGNADTKAGSRLLRIGTVGPYQFFGDRQVYNNEKSPVSLLSDPVCDIYTMSRHDILRRLPKKLFSALFRAEQDMFPSDLQLVEMHKQNHRWSAFRQGMQDQAMVQGSTASSSRPRSLQDSNSRRGVDVDANMEFLGINPACAAEFLVRSDKTRHATLTSMDVELFSQSSAQFLRRFDGLRRDRGLKVALAKEGRLSHIKGTLEPMDKLRDPVSFLLEQHWAKLRNEGLDGFGLDLSEEPVDDEVLSPRAPPCASSPGSTSAAAVASRKFYQTPSSNSQWRELSTAAPPSAASSQSSFMPGGILLNGHAPSGEAEADSFDSAVGMPQSPSHGGHLAVGGRPRTTPGGPKPAWRRSVKLQPLDGGAMVTAGRTYTILRGADDGGDGLPSAAETSSSKIVRPRLLKGASYRSST